jgi:hypothetical protein
MHYYQGEASPPCVYLVHENNILIREELGGCWGPHTPRVPAPLSSFPPSSSCRPPPCVVPLSSWSLYPPSPSVSSSSYPPPPPRVLSLVVWLFPSSSSCRSILLLLFVMSFPSPPPPPPRCRSHGVSSSSCRSLLLLLLLFVVSFPPPLRHGVSLPPPCRCVVLSSSSSCRSLLLLLLLLLVSSLPPLPHVLFPSPSLSFTRSSSTSYFPCCRCGRSSTYNSSRFSHSSVPTSNPPTSLWKGERRVRFGRFCAYVRRSSRRSSRGSSCHSSRRSSRRSCVVRPAVRPVVCAHIPLRRGGAGAGILRGPGALAIGPTSLKRGEGHHAL